MKRFISILILPLVLLASCTQKKTDETTAKESIDTTIYNVKIRALEKQKIARNIEYTASLIAYEEVHYAPASPGRIEEIYVQVGSYVRKGSLIARMDRTQLINATEQLQTAQSNFERMDTLYKLKSISQQAWEASKMQYEIAKTNVDFLSKNTTLTSPINGIVTGKYFESGELYSGVPNTPAGKAAIVTIMQINPLKAKVNISERYYPMVKQGMKANISVDVYGDQVVGSVYKVYPTISSDSRTFPVEIAIPNPSQKLRPGMFARVSLDLGETEALLVPAIAIVKQEGTDNHYVFTVGKDNKARKILVEIGDRFDDNLEIVTDALKEGDQIIVAGQNKLMDGSNIKIVQ